MIETKIVIIKLRWDEKNTGHIALHNILPSEIEEVCNGNRIERAGHRNRIFLVGPTKRGRMLSVVLNQTTDAGVYYPVTAYESSNRSIEEYRQETKRGGGTA